MRFKYILLCLVFGLTNLYAQKNTTASPGDDYTMYWFDDDGDGYGNEAISHYWIIDAQPPGWVLNHDDCDDMDYNINLIVWYLDVDQDGFGNPMHSITQCGQPTPLWTTTAGDCNDHDETINPGSVWYVDADGDGYGTTTVVAAQCTQPANTSPNNLDCNDANNTITLAATWYVDADVDGYGSTTIAATQCTQPAGSSPNNLDCDDTNNTINSFIWYVDADGDGYGSTAVAGTQCTQPANSSSNNLDCNDSNITITVGPTWYVDADGDGFGSTTVAGTQCTQPANSSSNHLDCDDANNTITSGLTWYADADADGYGENSPTILACTQPTGYVANHLDLCPGVNGSISGCIVPNSSSNGFNGDNYILTMKPKIPVTDLQLITDPKDISTNITYYDGIGRPIQIIGSKQSLNDKDIAALTTYDALGRPLKEFLPFVSSQNTLAYINENSLESGTIAQYQSNYGTSVAFNQKSYEDSPLARVIKQSSPGTDWAMGSGHEIKYDYQLNTTADAVKLYQSNATFSADEVYVPTLSQTINYPAGELVKSITYDENNTSLSETDGSIVEFKNREGKVVLRRTYGIVGNGSAQTQHDTYYVYDQFGNLSFVVPPMVTNVVAQLSELCYQYRYDYRNRLIEKKLPGKQWEYTIYDKLDRIVAVGPVFPPFSDLTQYGWSITKYDAFKRVVLHGWISSPTPLISSTIRKNMQNNYTATVNETKLATGAPDTTVGGVNFRYTSAVYPISGYHVLSVNYYDNYEFPHAPTSIVTSVEGQPVYYNATVKPIGLTTGVWLRCTKTTSAFRNNANYMLYDEKARPIRIFNRNHENSPGGSNQIDSKFDFIGKTEYTSTQHKRINSDPVITVKDIFTYTKKDQLAMHTQQINGGNVQLIADNTYDDLGKLVLKKVGNTAAFPLQKVDYQYNVKGWLTGINNDPTNNAVLNTQDNDLFAFKINYNTVETSTNNFTGQELFNGNISETYWRSVNGNNLRKYSYLYDDLSRLRDAVYERPDTPGNINSYNESVTYDRNGNIMTLTRNGDSDTAFPVIGIDNLTYSYDPNSGNRLMKVTDTSNLSSGFKDDSNGFNDTTDDYAYDLNGNMKRDDNKGITQITYNHLNLPVLITFGTNGNIEYLYDASGQKIEKIVTIGSAVTTTKYFGGFQYVNNVLKFFSHSEGYVNKIGSAYMYVFNYTDHLGNIRLSYQDTNQDGQIATSEILEDNHYYPFGLKQAGYNSVNAQPQYKYKYNGKEYQDELGLNVYDYGFRQYMPDIGRWGVIDPFAEMYHNYSPYNYVLNNPLSYIDPTGMAVEEVEGGVKFTEGDAVSAFKLLTGKSKNAYVEVVGNKKDRNSMNASDKQFQNGNWSVLAVGSLSLASKALDAIGIGNHSLDNLIVSNHGAAGEENNYFGIEDNIHMNEENSITTSELLGYNSKNGVGLTDGEKQVGYFLNLGNKVKNGGNFILNFCSVGYGDYGNSNLEAFKTLLNDRVNIYMPTNEVKSSKLEYSTGMGLNTNQVLNANPNTRWIKSTTVVKDATMINSISISSKTQNPVRTK